MDDLIFNYVADGFSKRLDFIKYKPKTILISGSDFNHSTQTLSKHFPAARVFECDFNTLRRHKENKGLFKRWFNQRDKFQLLDIQQMDFEHPIDLIFSNLFLIRNNAASKNIIAWWQKLLKQQGMLFFSHLGPDSFKELLQLLGKESLIGQLSFLDDMHNIGDNLVKMGFVDPVVNMEKVIFQYKKSTTLIADMASLGILNNFLEALHLDIKSLQQQLETLLSAKKQLNLSYELLYIHAIKQDIIDYLPNMEQEILFYKK